MSVQEETRYEMMQGALAIRIEAAMMHNKRIIVPRQNPGPWELALLRTMKPVIVSLVGRIPTRPKPASRPK